VRAGSWGRVVLVVGIVAAPLPTLTAASPSQTPESAFQDEIAPARELLLAGRYAAAESLLTPWLIDSSNSRESTAALELADLWVEARVKGGKAGQPETLALAEHVVDVRERLGDPFGLSKSLHNLGLAFEERGESSRATEAHQRAVAIVRSAPSSVRNPPLADGLEQLARALIGQERFAEARKALEEARSIQLGFHVSESADFDQIVFLEALLHRSDGDYEHAAALLDKAGPELTSARPQHPDTVAVLQLEGDLLFLRGRGLESTRAKWTEALELSEQTLGPEHPHVVLILRRLALASKYSGDLLQARALQERAMRIVERAGGRCQKELPELLNDFAGVLRWAADYQEARRRYKQALDRSTACLGREHSMTVTVVYNQADLAIEMGDFVLAERLLRKATADWSKRLGLTHPYVARGLVTLAEVVALEGRDTDARSLLERALALRRRALGPDHPDVAVTLVKLATLLEKNGSLALASQRLGQALEIYELGKVPPDPDYLATALRLRARLSARRGDLAAARQDYGEVAAIRSRILGAEHPLTAAARGDVAAADFALGSHQSALDGALVAETAGRNQLQMTARFLPGRQALLYADERPRGLSLALSTLSAEHVNDVSRVFDAVVRSRGLVLEELAERSQWTVAAAPGRAALRASAAARQARYATLMLRSVQGEVVPRALLDEAQQQAEDAERELAEQSGMDRNEQDRSRAGLNEVRQALPAGTALVSFVRYERTRITTISGRAVTSVRPWYIALVTSNTAKPVAISIGAAVTVESAVEAWRNEFRDAAIVAVRADPDSARRSYRAAGERMRRLVWDPLAGYLSGASKVFIVPDGALNLVSFPALPTDGTRYLVETGPVLHLLSTERDLLQNSAVSSGRGLLAVGGPTYDAAPVTTVASTRGDDRGCGNGIALHFDDLPGTRAEVTDIARVWTTRSGANPALGSDDLLVLDRDAASKPAVMQAASGRLVLHFATHGFFLGSECQPVAGTRAVGGLASGTAPPVAMGRRPQNPLLISGLAFAGANKRISIREDQDSGILTAEEVASLDLHGTEWAVLSACDTGLGEIKSGEGVFGLRRAFQIAGVRTVIMSLWSVDDQSTRTWMQALYRERFQKDAGTADAVRNASLQMLQTRRARGENTHPFYWAAFVAAGDWR
jgi:CHAT domain-containing protein/tetratricopeptide (TPR) repeat protein